MFKTYFVLTTLLCGAFTHNSYAQEIQPHKKTIIISFNVLFHPNENVIEKHVRESLSIFRAIGLLFTGIPTKEEIKQQLFSSLQEIQLASLTIAPHTWQTNYAPWDTDYAYPPILNQMITSSTFAHEKAIYTKVTSHIRHHPNMGTTRKIILKAIADFLFQSKWMNKAMEADPNMVKLLEQLQKDGHKIILLAGVPGHAWDTFLASAPAAQIIKKFFTPDRCYVSGKKNILHTSSECYAMIIKEHALHPTKCIVIAHNTYDLAYPQEIGMHTLVYQSHNNNLETFYKKLKNAL
jgi:hypothetical protein